MDDGATAVRRRQLGYADTESQASQLRGAMINIVAETEQAGQSLELIHRQPWREPAFLAPAAMIASLALAVSWLVWNSVENSRREEAQRAQAEQARLEREGFERARAVAIARKQAEELAALRQPLPHSGVYRNVYGAFQVG